MLLSQTNTSHSQMHFQLGSDGRGSHHSVPAGGTACPSTGRCSRAGLTSSRSMARRCGTSPSKWFPRSFVRFSDSTLEPQDLHIVILHQSNLRMIEAIMKSLGLPMSKNVTTLEKYGNTAAASIPITLERAIENDRLHAGSPFSMRLRWRADLGRGSARLVRFTYVRAQPGVARGPRGRLARGLLPELVS